MFDDCKSKVLQLKAMGSALIGNRLERVRFARVGRWLPATALLVIAGCSWFEEEPTPPAPSQQAKATPPAPGEGEAMAGEEAKTPDINSVPNEAPKPSIVNLDTSLFRTMKISERFALQFRAEAFNVTNTPHFNNPSANVNSGDFMQITSALDDQRSMRFGLRLSF